MKILVAISKTPDTTAKISFAANDTKFNEEGVQFIMNPYDEWYALVRAIELIEAEGGSVTAINVGPAANDIVIRKALAIGADDAVRIDSDPQDAEYVARQIANYAKDQDFDAIFFGKETIDYNGSMVASMLAELLELPFISYASNIEKDGDNFLVSRDIEGGKETARISGRFVLSAAKGLAEQRIPNMRGIMMAKRKPLAILEPIEVENKLNVVKYSLPAEKGGVQMVDPENMDELVRLLKEEAKVI